MHKSSTASPHIFTRRELHQQSEQEAPSTIGETLRNTRIKKGLELNDIQQQTKISQRNLKAMEDGCYNELPAFSFSRGFYKMYARALELDPEHVVIHFEQEYAHHPKHKDLPTFNFGSQNREVEAMAERSSLLTFSSFGLILLILLFFGAFLCWFFSWNPASFLSQQLRNLSPQPRYETIQQATDTVSTRQQLLRRQWLDSAKLLLEPTKPGTLPG